MRIDPERIISLLYPPACPVCGRLLDRRQAVSGPEAMWQMQPDLPNPFLCPDCAAGISYPEEPRCLCCSRPVPFAREDLCFDCLRSRKDFDAQTSLMLHDEMSRKLLYDLKYHNCRDNTKALVWEAVRREGDRVIAWQPDVIIPVPLYKKREFKRGYNQALLLAEAFSVCLWANQKAADSSSQSSRGGKIPVDGGYLIRVRPTAPQKELDGRQRMANVQRAFGIHYRRRPDQYREKTVLLVDDIYTSGATLSACAAVLKAAGTKRVFGLTFSIG